MNSLSAASSNDSSLSVDLNRYKQAADVAYRYAKSQSERDDQTESSPFDEEDSDNKELN